MPTPEQIAADPRPPIGMAMTYLVGGTPRTGRVCFYERGTCPRYLTWQVQDDLPPWAWRCLYLGSKDIIEPAEYRHGARRPTAWEQVDQ